MSRKGVVYCKGNRAGRIEETTSGYLFAYDTHYLASSSSPAISLTLPKRTEPFRSPVLFPFFFGLLAEGALKETQCRQLRIDENDHFGRLLKTTHSDTIGDVTVVEEVET